MQQHPHRKVIESTVLSAAFVLCLIPDVVIRAAEEEDEDSFQALRDGAWHEVFSDSCTGDWKEKWFLDGRDANSYAGVAWIFGIHDRAWFERPIFGKIRYMAASGLERKCDIQAYVEKVNARMK